MMELDKFNKIMFFYTMISDIFRAVSLDKIRESKATVYKNPNIFQKEL
jgi:hypothetical protein